MLNRSTTQSLASLWISNSVNLSTLPLNSLTLSNLQRVLQNLPARNSEVDFVNLCKILTRMVAATSINSFSEEEKSLVVDVTELAVSIFHARITFRYSSGPSTLWEGNSLTTQLRELASTFGTIRRLFASVDAKIAQCIDYTLHLRMGVIHRALYQDSWTSLMYSVSHILFGFTPIYDLPGTPPVQRDSDQPLSGTDMWSVSDSKDTAREDYLSHIHILPTQFPTASDQDDWQEFLGSLDIPCLDDNNSDTQEISSPFLPSTFQFTLTPPFDHVVPTYQLEEAVAASPYEVTVCDTSSGNNYVTDSASEALSAAPSEAEIILVASYSTPTELPSSISDGVGTKDIGSVGRSKRKRARLSDVSADSPKEYEANHPRRSKRQRLSSCNTVSQRLGLGIGRRSVSCRVSKRDKENMV